ncbi:MAG: hypothetical protein HRJ53_10510, partial [Acidobacteria bacterium Pan2503]|nr:hypothetical protein [Candidatus Acidoferrum panamensis]
MPLLKDVPPPAKVVSKTRWWKRVAKLLIVCLGSVHNDGFRGGNKHDWIDGGPLVQHGKHTAGDMAVRTLYIEELKATMRGRFAWLGAGVLLLAVGSVATVGTQDTWLDGYGIIAYFLVPLAF